MQAERWEKIQELYQAALAEAPETRTDFLEHACAEEPSLQKEVESLLGLSSSVDSFLEHTPLSGSWKGRRLGNLDILELIGRGGMGEVYRARDVRLGRDVAVKVLPAAFAADPHLKSRLDREARVLAALSHAHIAAIYGLEESDGGDALAMEYVPGPTLADRLAHGAISVANAIEYAKQIAEALEYAHDNGVIHRDLKPANIKITPHNQIKLLDFGLAKVVDSGGAVRELPTLSIAESRPGAILGTPAYMAPEQAVGEPTTRQADIWAFGVIVYEMLSGKRPFQGASLSDTISALLHNDPDWHALPESTPVAIRTMLRHCLERDPKRRLRDIGDVRILIEEAATEPQLEPQVVRRRRIIPRVVAGIGMLALVFVFWFSRHRNDPERPLMRLDLDLGPDAVLDPTWGDVAVFSPDGTRIAFVSKGPDGQTRLSTRRLDQTQATVLAGTEGAHEPFFSPDGSWLGFFTLAIRSHQDVGKLKKVAVDGGGVTTICDAPGGTGGSWGEDGSIIAPLRWMGGLSRISSASGNPQPLTTLKSDELSHRYPQILPGGKAVLFTAWRGGSFDDARISVHSLASGRTKILQEKASYGRYASSGHLLFVRDSVLYAAPMNLDRLDVTAPAVPIIGDIAYIPFSGAAQFDSGINGALMYGKLRHTRSSVDWMNRSGDLTPLVKAPGSYVSLRMSPDGKRLALVTNEHWHQQLWMHDLERNTIMRIAPNLEIISGPVWTADGTRIVFVGIDDRFYWMKSDGSGAAEVLINIDGFPGSLAPDGKTLVFSRQTESTMWDLWTQALDSGDNRLVPRGEPQLLLRVPGSRLGEPAISPDGQWLAYMSDESNSGTFEVYVTPFSAGASARRLQISSGGGSFPVWSRHGRELFFQGRDNVIMVVAYTVDGESFHASSPQVWSAKQIPNVIFAERSFDIFPDGRRAAVILPAEKTPEESHDDHQLTFMLNMSDQLRRKVRAGL